MRRSLALAPGTDDGQLGLSGETPPPLPAGGAVVEHGGLSALSFPVGERELLGKAVAGEL